MPWQDVVKNVLDGLTQLNPQAAAQLQARQNAAQLLQERLFNQGLATKASARADQDLELNKQRVTIDKQNADRLQQMNEDAALDRKVAAQRQQTQDDRQYSREIGEDVNSGKLRPMAPAGPNVGTPSIPGIPMPTFATQGWNTEPLSTSSAMVPGPTTVTPGPMGAGPAIQAPPTDELPGFTTTPSAPPSAQNAWNGTPSTAVPNPPVQGPITSDPLDPTGMARYRWTTPEELGQQKTDQTVNAALAQEKARRTVAMQNLNDAIKANPSLSSQTRAALTIHAITGDTPPKDAGAQEELMKIVQGSVPGSPEYMTALRKLNDLTDSQTKAAPDKPDPGTWSLQQGQDGKWYDYNNKTRETRPSTLQKTSAAVESRRAQAKVIDAESNKLIADINAHRSKIGGLDSYWNAYKNGTPISDPATAGVMAHLASYAALQPALHGFRGQQALAEFERIIGGVPKNPDALIAAIRSVQGLSKTVQNPDADDTAGTAFDKTDLNYKPADPFAAFGGQAH